MTEFHHKNAIVRIHPGKRTAEEQRVAIEKAAQGLMKAVHKKKKAKASDAIHG